VREVCVATVSLSVLHAGDGRKGHSQMIPSSLFSSVAAEKTSDFLVGNGDQNRWVGLMDRYV
jgi:hypothetical protein